MNAAGRGARHEEEGPPGADQLRDYFGKRFAVHGASARGVDWRDELAQSGRFELLMGVIADGPGSSVCDLGCGYGALLGALRERAFAGEYEGIDISPALVEAARERHALDPAATFRVGTRPVGADYVVASGLFNNNLAASREMWIAHIDATLLDMVRSARIAALANFLPPATRSDVREDLHFEDPDRVRALLEASEAERVEILRSQELFDFTVVAWMQPDGS